MGILFSYLPPFALFTRPIEYPCYQAEKRLRYIFYRSLSRHIFKIKRHNFRNPVSYNSFYIILPEPHSQHPTTILLIF